MLATDFASGDRRRCAALTPTIGLRLMTFGFRLPDAVASGDLLGWHALHAGRLRSRLRDMLTLTGSIVFWPTHQLHSCGCSLVVTTAELRSCNAVPLTWYLRSHSIAVSTMGIVRRWFLTHSASAHEARPRCCIPPTFVGRVCRISARTYGLSPYGIAATLWRNSRASGLIPVRFTALHRNVDSVSAPCRSPRRSQPRTICVAPTCKLNRIVSPQETPPQRNGSLSLWGMLVIAMQFLTYPRETLFLARLQGP